MACGNEENPSITLVQSVESIAEQYRIDIESMWRICLYRSLKELHERQGKNRVTKTVEANLSLYKENEHDEVG